MNRTCVRQIVDRVRGERDAGGRGLHRRSGSARRSPHAMTRPDEHRHADRQVPRGGPRRAARATTRRCIRSTPSRRCRKNPVTSAAAMRVAVMIASPPDATEPRMTAMSPSRASPVSSFVSPRVPEPTFSTSAAATPSGYGRSECRDQRAAQRNREQHAEHAAAHADEERLPERETRSTSRRSRVPAARR